MKYTVDSIVKRTNMLCFLEMMAAFGHLVESMPAVAAEGDLDYLDIHTCYMEGAGDNLLPIHQIGREYWMTLTNEQRQDLVDEFWATREEKAEEWVKINRDDCGIEISGVC